MGARSRSSIGLIGIIAVALTLSACGSSSKSDSKTSAATSAAAGSSPAASSSAATGPNTPAPKPLATMTDVTASVPFLNIEGYAPLLLANYFGEFKKENLNVTIQTVTTNNLVVLMQQGKVDFAPAAPSAGIFNAIQGGADIKGIGGGVMFSKDDLQGYYLRKGLIGSDGKFNPCDLKGKKVSTGSATGLGAPSVVELASYLAKCNLTVNDVTIVPQGGTDLFAALSAGAVDAGYLADPIWPQAVSAGMLLIQPFTAGITSYFMGPIRTKQPEVAAAIARAMIRTVRTYLQGDYRADPTVHAAMMKALGATEAQLTGPSPLVFSPDWKFPVDLIAPIEAEWIKIGKLLNYTTPLPTSSYYDDSIRLAALK
jgi:NitT/TauT family transport system substrate-binding protein